MKKAIEDGSIFGVSVFANDVTDQVISSKNIEYNESHYQSLIQSMPLAVYTCDTDGCIQLYNKAAIELWGFEPELGKAKFSDSLKLFNLDGAELSLECCPLTITLKTGKAVSGEEVIIERLNGERRHVLPNPQPIFDENGTIVGAVNALIDITEIRESQARLKERDEQFHAEILESEKSRAKELAEKIQQRTHELSESNKQLQQKNHELEDAREKLMSDYSRNLIEASLDPLITINTDGKITDMNVAMIVVTGKTRTRLVGSKFENYFTDPQEACKVYQEVFEKGFVQNSPLTIKDHTHTDVLFNGSVYKNDLGDVIGAVMVARDITEQKRIEKELIEAKVLAEKAAIIAEESKSRAETATLIAVDAVKAKQQFLSNMSHEIRTPMNAIIGFTNVILKTDLTAKQKEYLAAIKTSGDTLIVLINDILDLAKVDAGKMTFEQTPFKMASTMSAMLHLFETKIQDKNLNLVTEYDSNIPKVLLGDPVRLRQIILNLVSNAIKFTANGTITVNVRLLYENKENAGIEFSVTDTGIGIREDQIEGIFENFQQAYAETSRLFGGTGLGLAITKQLVEQQGGRIRVKSKIDEGTIFSFMLNFIKTNSEAELETVLSELDLEIKNIKVLVVEDMALNQLLMKAVLDDFGFDRDIADNGKIAIEKLQSKTYDVILMDLQMPEMNGFEATEYIRNTLNSNIPIIALTADVTTVDLEKCKAAGMNDYIAKPIDERSLYNKIVGLVMKPLLDTLPKGNSIYYPKKIKYTHLDYLMQRTKNNSSLVMEMIEAYLTQTPVLTNVMKISLLNKDWDSLCSAAHKMIPSFAIMGISVDFENMAKKIQEDARSQQKLEGISALVSQIEHVCARACEELEEEVKRFKSVEHEG